MTSHPPCPVCGAPCPELDNNGPWLYAHEKEPDTLLRVFGDDATTARCSAGGCRLPVTASISVGLNDPWRLLMAPGTRIAGDWDGIVSQLRQDNPQLSVETYPSADELRAGLAAALNARLETVREALASAERGELKSWIGGRFVELTPALFAAALVALSRPGHSLELPDRAGGRETLDTLAELQAGIWWLVSILWMSRPDELRIEDLLSRFVDDSPVVPGAIARLFDEWREPVEDQPAQSALLYSQEAVRASVCALAGQDNPYRQDWADLFIGFELAVRGTEWEPKSPLRNQRISPTRAAATITRRCAWIAAGTRIRRLRERGAADLDTTVAHLDEICTAAGHPGLVPALTGQRSRVS
jgi:hypothetical protein